MTINQWKIWAKTFPARAEKDAPYKSPFQVVNKGSETESAEILIYDQIGRDWWSGEGCAASDFAEKLKDIDPKARLVVGINSPGGNVDDGLAIYNALRRRGNVVTRNDGMAASIASIILQAGDQRESADTAMVMIHKAWGLCVGNSDDAEKYAEILAKHDQLLAETYAKHSGGEVSAWLEKMAEETWFTGNEAKESGLVDSIVEPTQNNSARASVASKKIDAMQIPAPRASLSIPATAGVDSQQSAAIQNKVKETKNMSDTNAPAAAQPTADLTPVIAAINALGDKITNANTQPPGAPPVAGSGVQVLENPLLKRYNDLSHDKPEQAKLAKGLYNDLRKQLLIANGVKDAEIFAGKFDRFDHSNRQILNANTVDSALANTILSADFATTMRTYIAPWSAFTRTVSLSPVSRRQVLEVPLASSAGSKQQNATNYESGDSVLAPIAVTVAEESKSFHVSRPEANLGLQLAALIPTNAKVLAEGIHAKMTALMTTGNFGTGTVIGTAANFDKTDLPAILALGKNYDQVRLLLDGGHLAYLLPGDRNAFTYGEPGAYGFDGGIYKNNLWTSATTNTVGLVCGPDAIVNAWGAADGLPAGEAISQSVVDVNGIPFTMSVWFSRASRAVWASFQVMHGCAVGDATQAEVLLSA